MIKTKQYATEIEDRINEFLSRVISKETTRRDVTMIHKRIFIDNITGVKFSVKIEAVI